MEITRKGVDWENNKMPWNSNKESKDMYEDFEKSIGYISTW